jgi:hypothetical protein
MRWLIAPADEFVGVWIPDRRICVWIPINAAVNNCAWYPPKPGIRGDMAWNSERLTAHSLTAILKACGT